ncbi:MAG: PQQ-binding-like beta-propeller repeat protein [Paludibacter sp.]
MRKYAFLLFSIVFLFQCNSVTFATEPFRFALFTDLHLNVNNPTPAEDLHNAVNEVNSTKGIDFVLVSGDISESGDSISLSNAKKILDKLLIPYYITAGNHETKWSESGATDFAHIFGNDKFVFTHKGCEFIGFTTGPIIKMGDGHIAPQDIDWVQSELNKTGNSMPVFIITHYPLLKGDVDNWYEMTDVIRRYNVQAVLGGHYHRNMVLNYDEIPGIVNRSTLRATDTVGGYSVYSISDSIRVYEKKIGQDPKLWLTLAFETKKYDRPETALKPSFEVNTINKNVKEIWKINSRVGLYCTPAVANNMVFYGDDLGYMNAVSLQNGKNSWKFKTGNRIISSPAVASDRVVFGSTDGSIYCLKASSGELIWKFKTAKAVMGNPLVKNDTVFIGGSDGNFRAISLKDGSQLWKFSGLRGYVETKPVYAQNKIYFGAWDTNFYALNATNGSLAWKWNNGNPGMHNSPAAVLPVYSHAKIFITAPDRFWTALDAETGKVIWRTNLHEVRETEGISEDGNVVYSRCMNDSVVALDTRTNSPKLIWKTGACYGYDHNPSMLVERAGIIVFGTKNGLLHGIDAKTGAVLWRHKIGNSIINTVNIISKNECVLTTSEGIIAKIRY